LDLIHPDYLSSKIRHMAIPTPEAGSVVPSGLSFRILLDSTATLDVMKIFRLSKLIWCLFFVAVTVVNVTKRTDSLIEVLHAERACLQTISARLINTINLIWGGR
jgi:hypothetical protein